MNKKRVLHVIGGLSAGGMENMVMNYYRNIDREKIQFDFLVFSENGIYEEEVRKLGGKVFYITPRRKSIFNNYLELKQFFKKNQYKIIHFHQGITYFLPLKMATEINVKNRIIHSHGIDIKYNTLHYRPYKKYAITKICKMATDYVACSLDAAKQLFHKQIINESKYRIISNAVSVSKFKLNESVRSKLRMQYGLENNYVIGHVSNFAPAKNMSFLLKVFKEVSNKNKNAILLLIGDGPTRPQLINLCRELKIIDKVKFLGVKKNIHELMQVMDVFFMPSLFEGLPVVLIEAQSVGLPCIVSSRITNEVKITDLVKFLDLEKDVSFWANEIMYYGNHVKEDHSKEIIRAGYAIEYEANKLQSYYLNL